jgi:4,5-dihydroxyphthalate decarboxylase
MADLKLSFAMTPYDRVLPLINGEVKPDGIELEYTGMPGAVPRVFYEQIKFQRYDISEMSMSSFLRMRSINWPYRMLPVFHNRNFSYTFIHIRLGPGIRQGHPEDLKGKRIGIGDYQQSLGLWTRGILQMEFGIKPEDMVWYQERGEHFSHTGASQEAGLALPSKVKINYAKTDFGTMYLNGELDASTGLGWVKDGFPALTANMSVFLRILKLSHYFPTHARSPSAFTRKLVFILRTIRQWFVKVFLTNTPGLLSV